MFLHERKLLFLSHPLFFFLPPKPQCPCQSSWISHSKVSDAPLRMSKGFWRLWNLNFPFKIPSFPGRKREIGFCQSRWIKLPCVVLGYISDMERKGKEFLRVPPTVPPTHPHSDHSKLFKWKGRGWPHRCPRGLACLAALLWQLSHSSDMLPQGASQCVQ